MGLTFRDEKGAPLTHEELDENFRSFFYTASFAENQLILQRKDGITTTVPIGGEAFADFQENGGSIGNVYIADSQITGSRMIVDLFNGQFYDKTKAPNSAGGNLTSDEWYIDFDPAATAPYYVHFGSKFAISSSGFMHAAGAKLEGEITASSGLIGGFNITPDAIHGPTTLGVPSFLISGSAGDTEHFISASNFSLKGNGDITGSSVHFNGGTIAGWTISNSTIAKDTNIVLDATNESFSINDSTFGNKGIQLQYNSGTPRFYVGDATGSFVKFDGTNVSVSTSILEISATNIEISSTEASMSLGGGSIKLLGATSAIEVGETNKFKISGSATDAMIIAGAKTGFDTDDAGIVMGMDSTVPTLDLTKDANNYFRFNTTSGVDIKTDTFKLDTTNFDIDTSTQRLTIFNTTSSEIIRLGEISDAADDLYGIKIFNGAGTGSANTIAMFGQQGNKIGGWEITDSQIRTIPAAGFGENYAENETGLIIHSDGKLETSNFATNLKGWRIDTAGNGTAEFENMRVRGTLSTTVFEKETVNVVGGQLMVANATTIQPLKDVDGAIIAGSSSYAANAVTFSVANTSGFTEGEVLKIKSVDDAGFSVEYVYVSGSKRYSEDSSISGNTGSIDPDGLAGEIYVERAYGGTPAVSSSITTLTSNIDTAAETTINVANASSLGVQNIIKIGNERLKITAINSNDLTVIRDYHDTTAVSHVNGDTVYLIDLDAEFLSGLVSTAKPYNEGQVLVSTGVFNSAQDISSGYIMMNANPRDISTPYMDIVERTGSGAYDLQLRSRLGDLSGLASGYLYGNNEPGFGLYTENGFFKGAITAETGSIAGQLHVATVAGGLETGQKVTIGRNVSGTNDGIYINSNNYWYTDGGWKVGGSDNFISLDNFTDGNLVINTETFALDTSTFVISSSLNNGTLAAGTNAGNMTSTTGTGVYLDGTGKFRVGTGTTGTNYIYWDGTTLNIKGNIDITGGSGVNTAELNAATSSLSGSLGTEISASDAAFSASVESTTNTLDGKIFTDSAGRAVRPPTASDEGLYLASTNLGFYKDGEWKTYMDNQGDFFLTGSEGNKLAWDSSTGTLEIAGEINITSGNAATQDYVTGSINTVSGSIATGVSASNAALSASISSSTATLQDGLDSANNLIEGKAAIFRQNEPPSTSDRTVGDMWIDANDSNKVYIWNGTEWAATPDGTYDQAVLINTTSTSLSSSVAADIFTDSTGKLVGTPDTSSAGLYLGDTALGFYSASEWRTYMANNGNFYLTGSDGNFLTWDGGQLSIKGSINITGGNAATSTDVSNAQTAAETFASASTANAILSGSAAASAAQTAAETTAAAALATATGSLETDISQSAVNTSASFATQAQTNAAFELVQAGLNSIFKQNEAPSTESRHQGDIWIDADGGNQLYVFSGSEWVTASDTTYDQSQLISDTAATQSLNTFTDSSGRIVRTPSTTQDGLYLGDSALGFYSGSSWRTYMADNGNFFLTGSDTNFLKWDGGQLTIAGSINIVGGNAATTQSVTDAQTAAENFATTASNAVSASLTGSIATAQQAGEDASTAALQAQLTASAATETAESASAEASTVQGNLDLATGSLETSIGNVATTASLSASAAQTAAENFATTASNDAQTAAESYADTATDALTGSINTALTRSVDAAGQITFPATPTGEGLYIGADKLGFYGEANVLGNTGNMWRTLLSSSGEFYLLGDSGSTGLAWTSNELTVDGTVIARAGEIGGITLEDSKLYNGEGTHSDADTGFYLDSSSNFSLGDKLVWDGENLSIEGSITITNTTYALQSDFNTATGSLETTIGNVASTASAEASAAQTAAQNFATTASDAAQTAAETTAAEALNTATGSLETSIGNVATTASLSASAAQTAAENFATTASNAAQTAAETTAAAALNTATGSLQEYADGAVSDVTGSIADAQSTANAATSSAASAQSTANAATSSAATAQATADAATGSIETLIAVTSSFVNPTTYDFGPSAQFTLNTLGDTPNGAGLYLGGDKLGYYNASNWMSYMGNDGTFILSGSGDDGLIWNGSSLRIGNPGISPSLVYGFWPGTLDDNVFDSSDGMLITAVTSPTVGATFQNTGSSAWDEGFHTKAVFDRNEGQVFEWDVIVGDQNPATYLGLYEESPQRFDYDQLICGFYLQSKKIQVKEFLPGADTVVHDLATNAWDDDPDFSEAQYFRLRLTIKSEGAVYEAFKNGDFTSPLGTIDTTSNGHTAQYFRPGIVIHYSDDVASHADNKVILMQMSAGATIGQATRISGNAVQTGAIISTNWGAQYGTQLDLENSTFKLGGSTSPKLSFDGTNLSVVGNITVTNPDTFATPSSKNKSDYNIILVATGSANSSTSAFTISEISNLGYTGGNNGSHFYDNNNDTDGNINPSNIVGYDSVDYDLYVFDCRNWAINGSEVQLALNLFDQGKSVLVTGNDNTVANYTGSYNTEWPIATTVDGSGTWQQGALATGSGIPSSHPILSGVTEFGTSTNTDTGKKITKLKRLPQGGSIVMPLGVSGSTQMTATTSEFISGSGAVIGFLMTNPRGGRLINLNLYGLSSVNSKLRENITNFLLRTDPAIEAHYLQVTSITGEMVNTGRVESTNYIHGSGDFSTQGTSIDLDNGSIRATQFEIDTSGNAKFAGDITGASGIFSGNITAAGGTVGGYTIHGDKLFTGTDENVSTYTSTAGRLIVSSSGAIHTNKFYVDKNGNAGFRGSLSGADITGANGTFTGTVEIGGTDLTLANTLNTEDPMSAASLTFNPNFLQVASDGRPAGVYAVYGSSAASNISYSGSASDGVVALESNSDISIGAAFSAFSVESGKKYKLIVRLKSSQTSNNGLYIRMAELDSDMPTNTVAISGNTVNETKAADGSRPQGPLSNFSVDGASVPSFNNIETNEDAYRVYQAIYTPTSTAKYASPNILNWDALGNEALYIDRVIVQETSDIYTGTVGGWTISDSAIYSSPTPDTAEFTTTGITIASNGGFHSPNFYISSSGQAYFKGLISASALYGSEIYGTTIEGGSIIGGTLAGGSLAIPEASGSVTSSFIVDSEGNMTASNANISGTVNADGGTIGDWIIDETTNVLRDSDSELILDPNTPEIAMFSSGSKKLSLSPVGSLTPTGGQSTTLTGLSLGNTFSVTSNSSNNNDVYLTKTGSLSSQTYTAGGPGDYVMFVDVPTFKVEKPSGTYANTVSQPTYNSTAGAFHGLYPGPNPAFNQATLAIEAVRVSDGTVLGSTQIGTSSAYQNKGSWTFYYASGSSSSNTQTGLQAGFQSVEANTEITVKNGGFKLAKDITVGDKIIGIDFSENTNRVTEAEIAQVSSREVEETYRVVTSLKEVVVSDSHEFAIAGNERLKVKDLIPGETLLYTLEGSIIQQEIVESVTLENSENKQVFTFEVTPTHNYISDGILSHNAGADGFGPSGPSDDDDGDAPGSGYTWEDDDTIANNNPTWTTQPAQNNKQVNLNLSAGGDIKFRYKWVFRARSKKQYNFGSTSSNYTTSYTAHTFNGWETTPTISNESASIQTPSNFVELKSGGIQIVSSDTKYVTMPRLDNTGDEFDVLFKTAGGTMATHHIRPVSSANNSELGTSSYRYKKLNGIDISNLAISVQDGPRTFTTTTNSVTDNFDNYTKLPGGLIIQWGHIYDTSDPKLVTFPVTFPNAVHSVVCSTNRSSSGSSGYNHVYDYSRSKASLVLDSAYGFWVAFGY